jgi:hypothetical protein
VPGEPELLLADRKDLRRFHLLTKKYTQLINNSNIERPVAMDFHIKERYVYWTDDSKNQINRWVMGNGFQVKSSQVSISLFHKI